MASRLVPSHGLEEGRFGASNPSLARRQLQECVVHDAPLARSDTFWRGWVAAAARRRGKIVEIDETLMGRREGSPKPMGQGDGSQRRNNPVLTLVERGGSARSFHEEGTTLGTLLPIIRANVSRESAVMTDAAGWYKFLKENDDVSSHERVDHNQGEYVRDG
jgi:ISXO2-like transposase domain